MIRFNIAYRHGSGEVEGFSAFRFTSDAAEQAAIGLIQEKLALQGQAYDAKRLIRRFKGLTKAEARQLKADWHLYDKQAPGQSGLRRRQ